MRRSLAAFVLCFVGCTGGTDVFLEQEWPAGHTTLVLVMDDDGRALDGPRFVGAGQRVLASFDHGAPFRVFVRTYSESKRAPNGSPLTSCAIHIGPGEKLPAPSTAWRTPLVDASSGETFQFRPEPLDALTDIDIHFVDCAPIDRGCDGLAIEAIDLPVGLVPQSVATVNDDVAMIGGDVHPGPNALTMFGRLEGNEVRILDPVDGLSNGVVELEYDGVGRFVGLHDDDHDVFVVDAQGMKSTLARELFMEGVSAGNDGTILAFDTDRTVELLEGGRVIVERTDVPFGLYGLDVDSATRILARTQKTLYSYDGRAWVESWEVPLLEEISDLAIDEDIMALIGNLEHARVRDPTTGIWERLPYPLDLGRRIRALASLRGGRFVAVGDAGFVWVWTGTRWCDLSVPDLRVPVRDVSASPSGKIAYAVWKNQRSGKLLRIIAPEPTIR